MELWQKLADETSSLRKLLDKYLEMRTSLKEWGYTEETIKKIGSGPARLWELRRDLGYLQDSLFSEIIDYGFDVNWDEFADYIKPKYNKIDELTPLG